MSDVKKIGPYNIKDATARDTITSYGSRLTAVESKATANESSISSTNTTVSGHSTVIGNLTTRVTALEAIDQLTMEYDAATETINFI